MMRYILTYPGLVNSANPLATALGLRVSTVPRIDPPTIRWGNSMGRYVRDTNYNRPTQIITAGNKRLFSQTMVKSNIPNVEYHYDEIPEHYPIVVRTILNGHGGEGIIICNNAEEWRVNKGSVWSYWYNFEFELGVHILGGKIVRIFKKIWRDGEPPDANFPIRNLEKGWSFSLRNLDHYKKLVPMVELFYETFPINMARLDIGWDSDAKLYRIIECNSAPALSNNENTLEAYIRYLKTVL